MPTSQLTKPRRARRRNGLIAFLSQAIKEVQHTGAVLPSSTALARAMTKPLRAATASKRVLEVGPGTGPFTKAILKTLQPGDELHVVEINRVFAERLDSVILEPFRHRHSRILVKLYCDPIETAPLEGQFDFIVCSLPFNNFPPVLVRSIFRRMFEMLAPGGELTYFEYAGVRAIKGPLVGNKGRKRLQDIGAVGKVLRRKHQGKRELVIGNVPPALAVRLKRG